jgi:hypothetical protein
MCRLVQGVIPNVNLSVGIRFEAQNILRGRTNRLEAVSFSKRLEIGEVKCLKYLPKERTN